MERIKNLLGQILELYEQIPKQWRFAHEKIKIALNNIQDEWRIESDTKSIMRQEYRELNEQYIFCSKRCEKLQKEIDRLNKLLNTDLIKGKI